MCRQPHREGGSYAKLAFDRDPATHQAAEALADSQSKPCSSVFPRSGSFGLAEFLEQTGQLLRRHANARILDLQNKLRGLVMPFKSNTQPQFAVFRKFRSIADQIQQYLLQSGAILV